MKQFFCLVFLFCSSLLSAQTSESAPAEDSPESRVAKATELAIPTSPAFNMLNENTPSRIERYAAIHDFKVDWSLTNGQQGYAISPGLAIEAQPIWLLFFDRAGAAKYRQATPLARTFSTLSLSIGTNASNDKNWLAWGAKLNLYRQHDPLNDKEYLRSLEETTEEAKDSFLLKIKTLEMQQIRLSRRDSAYETRLQALHDSIAQVDLDILDLERAQTQKLAEARERYIQKHWNSGFLDLAFGRLHTYANVQDTLFEIFQQPGTPELLDTAALPNNTLVLSKQGYAVWLSGGIGIGSSGLVSGMVRYGKKPSRLTGTIGEVLSVGLNLRYGTRRYNFFIEGFIDRFRDPLAGAPGVRFRQDFYMLTIGADWRFSRNVMLNIGLRQYKDFKNGTYLITPLLNVNCLMR